MTARALGFGILGSAILGLAMIVAGNAQSLVASEPGQNAAAAGRAQWTEVPWPFGMDEWGIGRAFTCKAADCGSDVALYLRAKVGFCNCTTGVTEDDDLDRVADLPLLSNAFVGLAEGRPVVVAGMSGRSRPYQVSLPLWRAQTAVAVVLHAKCDALVATIVADRDRLAGAEQYGLAFLGGAPVLDWAKLALGS
jgi:hypothetical protein